jgi:hypothetical protein
LRFYFPCYSLAGTAEAKQALLEELPICYNFEVCG